MIILGVILLIIGFVVNIPILWTIGVVLLVIGIILYALGAAGMPSVVAALLLIRCRLVVRIRASRRGRYGALNGTRNQFPKADLAQRSLLPVAAVACD